MTAAFREDLIPAYRVKRDDGGLSLKFRCPHCRTVHTHGEPPDEPAVVTGRVAHCHDPRSPWRGSGYRLMIVGAVGSSRQLPSITAADIVALNEAMAGR
ncbi:hypothetical protein [Bradyrhizobium erythrophlei]|uniref:Uncharacterized protein n=1 Tax=Bradyrhizobium erythrophlei TaxID=1437360 RepID=A0A1M5HJN4_9BRAD|nr:hypothetical protein [Bradyrhizobium erythrophlei]SHG16032.1 hypothetical protein SAMN05444169_0858 [Bradyrhizobium erythrophlei]